MYASARVPLLWLIPVDQVSRCRRLTLAIALSRKDMHGQLTNRFSRLLTALPASAM